LEVIIGDSKTGIVLEMERTSERGEIGGLGQEHNGCQPTGNDSDLLQAEDQYTTRNKPGRSVK
jgi:hypothetical protein